MSSSFLILISIIFRPEFLFSSSQAWVTQTSIRTGTKFVDLLFVKSKSAINPFISASSVQVS